VAEANDIQPAVYEAQPESALPDPAVATAVFALSANQVSAPIQGRVGFSVAKVTVILPGTPATLEGVRGAIVAELQEEDMKARVYARVEAYEKARTEGKPLAVAAEQVGARFVQLPPFTQDGRLPDGQPMNAPPQILQSAYALTRCGESDVIDAGQGQYFVLRLDEVKPAALPPLDEVRTELSAAWIQRENARLLRTKADELAGRIRAGEDILAVARSAGAEIIVRTGVQQDEETAEALGGGLLEGLFGQGKGQAFVQPVAEDVFVVGVTDAIRPPVPALAAPIAERIRPRIGQDLVGGLGDLAISAGQRRTKAESDPGLAREALGLPREAPATPPAAK
jgi:peptidyl-prolyl cis-trans isomerase D